MRAQLFEETLKQILDIAEKAKSAPLDAVSNSGRTGKIDIHTETSAIYRIAKLAKEALKR